MEQPQQHIFHQSRMPLPNATTVFVLGICSILFFCIVIGFILGIIGLVIAREPRELYKQNPGQYEGYGLLNAGWIMSIIGTSLGGLSILYWVIMVWIALNAR